MSLVCVAVKLRSFTLRNFIEDVHGASASTGICVLRSFTLRNFIEEENGGYTFNGNPIAKLYASQLH